VTREDKRAALESVLQTAAFVRAGQLRSFLRFVCEMEMDGRAPEITEYLIGVEALGRAAGYSTAEDSIVRRRAIDLRDKLDEVYATELATAPLRIELPKGRYVPHFVARDAPAREPAAAPEAAVTVRPVAPSRSRTPFALGFLLGVVAGAAASFVLLRAGRVAPAAAEGGVPYEGEATGSGFGGSTTPGECGVCSGGRRVRNIGNGPMNHLDINGVRVAEDGRYTVRVEYLLEGRRSFFLSVDGGVPVELAVQGESWVTVSTASVTLFLKAGYNSIRFSNDQAYAPDLDRIVVDPNPRP
jgi:hypothetical protein